jgi:hypothetical protein
MAATGQATVRPCISFLHQPSQARHKRSVLTFRWSLVAEASLHAESLARWLEHVTELAIVAPNEPG